MGRKDSKHKKKSSHKKKHKKEKKKHKEKKSKHHKKSSDSSDSSTSSDSSSYISEDDRKQEKTNPVISRKSNSDDESQWSELFSDRNTITKEKTQPKRDRTILDKPGQSARELNPYWKDGGSGLPPTRDEVINSGKEYDVKSLKKLLEQAKDTAEVTGVPVEKIIEEEWGPIAKLKEIIENAENKKYKDEGIKKSVFHRPASSSERSGSGFDEKTERRMNFLKPGEHSHLEYSNTYSQNWRKKDESAAGKPEPVASHESKKMEAEEPESSEKKAVLTLDELNKLAAKAMKAELMGNNSLAEQIRKEIEAAKKNRAESTSAGERKTEKRSEEVVLLTKTSAKGMTMPCDMPSNDFSQGSRRQKGETHKGKERIRYFLDDDKHSLKSMFEKEKFSTSDQSDEMFLKMARKGKIQSNDDDFADEYLDRVRGSDYQRKESEKERNRTLKEAKSKHKSLSNCRWCLEGNNVQKHLIISVGTTCYLCLPSDESLTNGHCLIVPVHHETCGTTLDEDVWNEMQMYRKNLCRMFEDDGQDVVFFENARSFHRYPHMILNCVPMDKEIGDMAPIYFKKAILESETEWSNNKKLVDLRDKDLRRSVPKGVPYFAVDFGRDGGFAHVIEDEKLFPPNFAEEIIGGMLDLDYSKWRKRKKESFENQKEKVEEFSKRWKKYEVAESRKRPRPRSDSSSSE